jgi:hypothetical protein
MPYGSAWAWCGFRRTALSAGLRVSETKQEITVEAAMVVANCVKKRPEIPEMKADGRNTAHSVSAMAMSAVETSSIVRCAASRGDMPSAMLRSMFSTTTMASSTTMPTASTRPNSDRLLIEMPSAARTEKAPTSDTGMATTGMIVARQLCKNR